MTALADIAKDPARAVFVVTRDPRILPFVSRMVRIEDGRIVGEERGRCSAEQEAREAKTVAGSMDYAET
jgi:ABC-type lipoprotein export system ATPase subunit